jgi:hypothetical protein
MELPVVIALHANQLRTSSYATKHRFDPYRFFCSGLWRMNYISQQQ